MVMEQLTHLINATFSDVEKFETSHHHRRYTLQSLYTALNHKLQDGLMAQHEFDRMRYVVGKLFDLKLQIHATYNCTDVGSALSGYTSEIAIHLYSFAVAVGEHH